MDTILNKSEEKRGINKVFVGGMIAAVAAIAVVILVLSLKPSMDEQRAQLLKGAYTEGTPEFADLNKDIIISTDDNTVQSPTGMGTISMFISGKIRNKGTRVINILEVNVGVVTQFNEFLKQKRILVVPVQQPQLGPGETIPITLTIDGFSKSDDRANIRWKVTAIRAE